MHAHTQHAQRISTDSWLTQTYDAWSGWLKSLLPCSCWVRTIWLSMLDWPAEARMSRTRKSPSSPHTHTHLPPRCSCELSCCPAATASACCLARCSRALGLPMLCCWSRKGGCLQMARQMELCLLCLLHCSQKHRDLVSQRLSADFK